MLRYLASGRRIVKALQNKCAPWAVPAAALAAIRVGALWVVIASVWRQGESIAHLPFVLLLYPEALLLPRQLSWTGWAGVGFSLLLVLGTFVSVVLVALVCRAVVCRAR